MPGLPRFAMPLVTTWAVLNALTSPPAGAAVRLARWEGPAVLAVSHAPGVPQYRLRAALVADRDDPPQASYLIQVVLPDGQALSHTIPAGEFRSRRIDVLVPAASIRDVRPEQVIVKARLLDAATGGPVSDDLVATIGDFPNPRPEGSQVDPGPFGWGTPLAPGRAGRLPRTNRDGLAFVSIPGGEGDTGPALFLAASEATNAQVAKRLPGYDPKAGRSDEFNLEDPAQPAVGLSPKQANAYLAAAGQADPSGVVYRLPTGAEWLRAARAGKESAFWWGDEATHPAGANFLGPEPALAHDATAPALPPKQDEGPGGTPTFAPNPWGLYHTFGNVAEWATDPEKGFVRLGGHFRTEPESPLPVVAAENEDATGPDAYVGVRPAVALSADSGADLVRKALGGNPGLAGLDVRFDPARATATLTGTLPDPSLRRDADRRLAPLWFLAAVENRVTTPTVPAGLLATLGDVTGPVRRITPVGRWVYEIPLAVRWADPLPVRGSEWWVNIYPASGGHLAHKLVEIEPNDTRRLVVLIDRALMTGLGQPADGPASVALSLGGQALTIGDPRIVSNIVPLRWSVPPETRPAPAPEARRPESP
jgi:hypothetical protein